jgi:hypothetical protein
MTPKMGNRNYMQKATGISKIGVLQEYILYFFAVIVTSHFFFYQLGFMHSNPENARSMVSTLVQSEATVIAIIISVSLVAVQIAASYYGMRIIDLFKNDMNFLIVPIYFFIIIFYGLIVIKLIPNEIIMKLQILIILYHFRFTLVYSHLFVLYFIFGVLWI